MGGNITHIIEIKLLLFRGFGLNNKRVGWIYRASKIRIEDQYTHTMM